MDPLTALPQLTEVLQKAGVLGVLVLICVVLAWEVLRLRKQAAQVFAERDQYRLYYAVYKAACDREGVKVDTAALAPLPSLPAPA